MTLTVVYDVETGLASLQPSLPLPIGQDLRFSLQDTRSRLYLTPSGWSATRKTLFQARLTEDDTTLHLDQPVTSLLTHGTPLLLEEIYVNYREAFVWSAPQPSPSPVAPDPEPPVAAVEPDHIEAAPVEAEAASEEAASPAGKLNPHEERRRQTVSPLLLGGSGVISGAILTAMLFMAAPFAPSSVATSDEIAAMESQIANLRREASNRESDLRATQEARDHLSAELERARQDRSSESNTSGPAELLRQMEQQKDIIIRYQKLLSEGSGKATPADEQTTLQILSERNAQLTKQVADQAETIAALQEDVRELRLKRDLSASDTRKKTPQGKWLALARDARGVVYIEAGYDSALEAREAAMEACRSDSMGCSSFGTREDTCYAIARPAAQMTKIHFWSGMGATQESAETDATALCQRASGASRCEISNVACAPASRSRT